MLRVRYPPFTITCVLMLLSHERKNSGDTLCTVTLLAGRDQLVFEKILFSRQMRIRLADVGFRACHSKQEHLTCIDNRLLSPMNAWHHVHLSDAHGNASLIHDDICNLNFCMQKSLRCAPIVISCYEFNEHSVTYRFDSVRTLSKLSGMTLLFQRSLRSNRPLI